MLLLNWKIAYGSNWAKVARGEQDKRIDAFAARVKAYGKKFFLALNHEPENDVIAGPAPAWRPRTSPPCTGTRSCGCAPRA